MFAKLPTVAAFALLGGCATVSEMVDDPSVEHTKIDETGHLIMTAREDNRLIRTTLTAEGRLQICAETQADAISARSAESSLELTGKGAFEDSVDRKLTLTYARTQVSDVVRQMAWQLCNANLNGQIGEVSYEASLRALQNQAMAVLASKPATDAEALKLMNDLAAKAEVSAAADRALQKTIEEERTKQSVETTKRAKIAQCGQASTLNEFNTCMATPT